MLTASDRRQSWADGREIHLRGTTGVRSPWLISMTYRKVRLGSPVERGYDECPCPKDCELHGECHLCVAMAAKIDCRVANASASF